MGKVRKKCSKVARVDPTGLAKAVKEECFSEELGPVATFTNAILEQLQSHLAEERDSGLNSLSVAATKPAYLEEVVKSDIFKIVGPLLLDTSLAVRHSAAGSLRSLSSVNVELCDKMVKDDVLTPLITLIQRTYCDCDWVPQSKGKKSAQPYKIDSATEAFIEAVTLLANLCEAGATAVKVFNREKLGDALCKFLNVDVFGCRVSLAAALCLYSATEDNSATISHHSQLEEILLKICTLSDDTPETYLLTHLQTTAVGILVNLYQGDLQKAPTAVSTNIMKTICKALDNDHATELKSFSSEIPADDIQQGRQEVYHREVDSDMKKLFEADEKTEKIIALLSSQVMSLEILSNITISDEDNWGEDEEDSSGESMEGFEEIDEGENDVEMQDIQSDLPLAVYEGLSSLGVIGKVLNKIKSLPENVVGILKEDSSRGVPLLRKYNVLRSTALVCLQNLVEVLSIADLEKVIGIVDLWTELGAILNECQATDEIMIEAITSAMRAIIQAIVNQKTVQPPSDKISAGLSVFRQVYDTVPIAKIKVNIIKIIGCVGLILSRLQRNDQVGDVNAETLITQIVEYFLHCLASVKMEKEGLWVAAEILDTLFDVFAEDDYNHVLKATGLVGKMKVLQPSFKRQVRSERRNLGENGPVIQTANTNLPRFIQYKEKHGA